MKIDSLICLSRIRLKIPIGTLKRKISSVFVAMTLEFSGILRNRDKGWRVGSEEQGIRIYIIVLYSSATFMNPLPHRLYVVDFLSASFESSFSSSIIHGRFQSR